MNNTEYAPRKGSKVALAAEAMRDGPLPATELAKIMETDSGSVNVLLAVAVENQYIVKVVDGENVVHYALGGMKLEPKFKPYKPAPLHAGGSNVADVPVVRRVQTPSVTPSAAALAAATPFWPGGPAKNTPVVGKKDTPATVESDDGKATTKGTSTDQQSQFAAGLFSNGELVINAGNESIRLSREHARELFDYLDKITDMIAA